MIYSMLIKKSTLGWKLWKPEANTMEQGGWEDLMDML
jgi:hypothetical protein